MIGRALVLNATFEPLCVVSSRRALVLVLDLKAELVHSTGSEYRSARACFPEPSVVRLAQYVRVPRQTKVAISRRSVFARDGHRCQYCGAQAENIDHVVPRSRGGTHSWDNVVASCRRCNAAKEDYLLEETGFVLHEKPRAPRSRVWLLAASGEVCADWEPYVARVLHKSGERRDPAA
ncbi:MAG: endonuclease [Acidimicrobiaceae bacterium]|jgi:5-methylcytosine-specific restriction endonuclease McrA|nr:endonuclease [Acidimicrobiaceae bacterium]